jgi:hypothetical protein
MNNKGLILDGNKTMFFLIDLENKKDVEIQNKIYDIYGFFLRKDN